MKPIKWRTDEEPKRFEWEEGDLVYIPVNTVHQHFNSDPDKPARFISASNRIYKELGMGRSGGTRRGSAVRKKIRIVKNSTEVIDVEQQMYDEERCFVRGIGSQGYSLKQEMERLRSMPRVIKGARLPWRSGPQVFHKNMMNPGHGLIQSLHCSQEELAPGGRSQKHGHQNPGVALRPRRRGV